MTNISELRPFDIFSHFDDTTLERLAGCASGQRYGAGSTLFRAGETTTESYLISEGAVTVTRDTPYGPFAVVDLQPGDLLGELAFIDPRGRTGEARTTTDSELVVFDPVVLAAACERDAKLDQALHWSLWRSLSAKLRNTNERLAAYFTGRVEPASGVARLPERELIAGGLDLESRRSLFREQALSAMEINFLATLSREERYGPGAVIFNQGAPGEEMYVVVDGQVVISTEVPGAGEEALSFLEHGEYFGEMALIDGQPRSADAKAHPEHGAVVLAIPGEVIGTILDLGRVSSVRLLKILCRLVAGRVRQIDEKLLGWFMLSGGDARRPGTRIALGS